MPLKQFDLGVLQLASQTATNNTPLRVSCSITLDLPASMDASTGLGDIVRLSTAGELWIAKATSCRMQANLSVDGGGTMTTTSTTTTILERLAQAVDGCSVWEELGLTLRREGAGPVQGGGEEEVETGLSYVVNHPDLLSGSLAPREIPCAQFVRVDFCFRYGGTGKRRAGTGTGPSRRKKRRMDGPEVSGEVAARRCSARIKTREVRDVESGDVDTMEEEEYVPLPEELAGMVKVAFYKFLGVRKKGTRGMRVKRSSAGPALIELAPAVWNLRYLQAFSSRADHIPWIASCLSGLDAESPSLRRKISSLAGGDGASHGRLEIQRRLHMLVHRGLDVAPIATSRCRSGKASRSTDVMAAPDPRPGLEMDINLELDDDGRWGEYPISDDSQLGSKPILGGEVDGDQPYTDEYGLNNVTLDDPYQLDDDLSHDPEYNLNNNLSRGEYDYINSLVQEEEYEWLDLSQASFILDENGQQITFEELEDEGFSYQLVPLAGD